MPQYPHLLIVDNHPKRRNSVALVLTSVGGFDAKECSIQALSDSAGSNNVVVMSSELNSQLPAGFCDPVIWYGSVRPVDFSSQNFVRWDEACPPNFAELVRQTLLKLENYND